MLRFFEFLISGSLRFGIFLFVLCFCAFWVSVVFVYEFYFMLLCFCVGFENGVVLVLGFILHGGDVLVMVTMGDNLVGVLVSCWTDDGGWR
jgi:hypothetical protein